MKAIQDSIAKRTSLKSCDSKKPAVVQCNGSDYGLGVTLVQDSQPIVFTSRTLPGAKQRYTKIEKECLAIVLACEKMKYS